MKTKVTNWRYVLPTVLAIVFIGLTVYSVQLERPSNRAILTTPTAEITSTPPSKWLQMDGVDGLRTECDRFPELDCNEDEVAIYSEGYWISVNNEGYPGSVMFLKTPGTPLVYALATITPGTTPTPVYEPTITPVPTITLEPAGIAVNIYGDHVSPVKGLNLRCEQTLYDHCNYGYLLPFCGYVSDGRDCNPNKDSVILTEVVFVDGGWVHREDTGWWGKWGDGWIAMCLDARDYDFVDVCGEGE